MASLLVTVVANASGDSTCGALADRVVHAQERVLHHVLGLRDAAEHAVGQREHQRPQGVVGEGQILHGPIEPRRGCHRTGPYPVGGATGKDGDHESAVSRCHRRPGKGAYPDAARGRPRSGRHHPDPQVPGCPGAGRRRAGAAGRARPGLGADRDDDGRARRGDPPAHRPQEPGQPEEVRRGVRRDQPAPDRGHRPPAAGGPRRRGEAVHRAELHRLEQPAGGQRAGDGGRRRSTRIPSRRRARPWRRSPTWSGS